GAGREGDRGCPPLALRAVQVQRAACSDTDCGGSELPLVLRPLAAVDDAAQGLNLVAETFGDFGAAVCDVTHAILGIANPVFRLFGPVVQSFAGVFVAAFQVTAELFAGLGCEQKAGQSAGSQAD